ncbi:MAG: Asp-tRNA(Asn)/Glu-tRNA(Gln) amidotransferase subunit GatB [Candidatus Marinimicrobia bacterium]|nr:Asp-tRNA(Asn)/Glu-tRNA(Gln) amidotransferase subunit GatB [Candidatus Neomarinimicrobiota bacterium]
MVIGLEVHVQLNTKSKLFCGCSNESLGKPNSRCCPICIGLPGSLPLPNKSAIEKSALFGIAVNSKINKSVQFSRKNYFYPDLPKGFQTSQFSLPICEGGEIKYLHDNMEKTVQLTRAHLEEDAGKLIHSVQDSATHIDLNRCGTPLLEIVSEPDLRSASEAKAYLTQLKQQIQYLEISNCDMEKGQLRCDANVSIRKNDSDEFGTRAEIKNVNSFKFVEKAINLEINRQIDILENGGKIKQCTLQYDDKADSISVLRLKEDAHDYRYFPCPDLPPVFIDDKIIKKLNDNCPEKPIEKVKRFQKDYKLSLSDSERICQESNFANYFENLIIKIGDVKKSKNILLGDISKLLKDKNISINELPISIDDISKLLNFQNNGSLSVSNFKKAFILKAESNNPLSTILEKNNLLNDDTHSLADIVIEVADANPSELLRYQSGEEKLKGFFMGQIMRKTQGKANPAELVKLIEALKTHSN